MQVPIFVKSFGELVCGAVSFYFFLRYALTSHPRDKRIALIAGLCLLTSIASYHLAAAEGALIHVRYDLYVYRIDQLMHWGKAGALMGEALRRVAWGDWALNFAYSLLSAAVMFLLIAYDATREFREVLYAVLITLAVAPLIYAFVPVSGPTYAFHGFPSGAALPMIVAPHIIFLRAPPNGIPSVHFSIALLVCWYLRKRPILFISASAFLLLTAVTILASGEHYLFDLVMAVPYAALTALTARSLCHRHSSDELLDLRVRSLEHYVDVGL